MAVQAKLQVRQLNRAGPVLKMDAKEGSAVMVSSGRLVVEAEHCRVVGVNAADDSRLFGALVGD